MYSRRTNTIEEKETPGRYYRRESERRRKEAEATHLASLHLASALQHTQVLQDRGSKDPFVVCKVYKCIFSYNIHPEARARKFITNIMRSNSGAFRCAVDPVNPRSLHRTFFFDMLQEDPLQRYKPSLPIRFRNTCEKTTKYRRLLKSRPFSQGWCRQSCLREAPFISILSMATVCGK